MPSEPRPTPAEAPELIDGSRVEGASDAGSALGDDSGAEEPSGTQPTDAIAVQPTRPSTLWAVVMVFDIAVDLPTPHALVTLREVAEPHRQLALPVGVPEATALAHAWRGVPTPRPLTHELFADVLVRLGATVEVVRLRGRQAGVVLGELELSSPLGREVLPCRPTDGLTLSIRQGVPAPILVDERLFDPEGDVEPT